MPNRKWAFKQIFNGLNTKVPHNTSMSGDGGDYFSDSGDDDHFDPSTVNRPHIDAKTEAQLRDACAIILQNLKPSGHDIEDTRMKSDILVEDLSDQDEPPVAAPPPAKRRSNTKPSGSTWYQDGSSRSSRAAIQQETHEALERRKAAIHNMNVGRTGDYKHTTNAMHQSQRDSGSAEAEQIESPIAPLPSARILSPLPPQPPPKTRGTNTGRNGSASTMSTEHTSSTNGIHSASTGVTSTSNSKRTSDPAESETAATIREEVMRRTQPVITKSDASTAYQSGATDETVQAVDHYLQAQAVPLVYSRASSMNSKTHAESTSAAPSSTQPVLKESPKDLQQSLRRLPPVNTAIQKTADGSRGDNLSPISPSDISEGPSPLLTDFDATLKAIRARMAATSLSARPVNAMLPEEPRFTSSAEQSGFRSMPQQSPPRHAVPNMPPLPDKPLHMDLSSVNDRWVASTNAAVDWQRGLERRSRIAQPNDIEPVEFDAFMSVVAHTAEDSGRPSPSILIRNAESVQQEAQHTPSENPKPQFQHQNSFHASAPVSPISEISQKVGTSGVSPIQSPHRPVSPPSRILSPGVNSPPLPSMPNHLGGHQSTHSKVASPSSTYSATPSSNPNQQVLPQSQQDYFGSDANAGWNNSQNIPTAKPGVSNGNHGFVPIQAKSMKSPSRLSVSSRTPSQHAMNGSNTLLQNESTAKSAFRRLIGRRKSRNFASSINSSHHNMHGTALVANGYDHINGNGYVNGNLVGYQTLEDPEYDDPLVCAAPVVAFGRGW